MTHLSGSIKVRMNTFFKPPQVQLGGSIENISETGVAVDILNT
jgi:hypothetical protein